MLAAGELRIPYGTPVAAHRMLLVIDPRQRIVRQINGLASWLEPDSGRWRHKPIGFLATDRLRGYDTRTHPRTFLPVHGVMLFSRDAAEALGRGDIAALATGLSEAEVEQRLAPALKALRQINGLSPGPEGGAGLPYPFLGFGRNSNSFYRTMLRVLRVEPPRFASSALIVPGEADLLLPEDVCERLSEDVALPS